MDPRIIRSTNFDVTVESDKAVFKGYGWGHGVGLCQWGAYFMALRGYKVEEILKFYYPGSKISQLK
jgi:stage II sporulation protein D